MALDHGGFTFAAFDHVGINRALHEEIHRADLFGNFFKRTDKFFADDLTLLFGLGNAFQFR